MCNFAKFYEHPLNTNCQFKLCMVITDFSQAHMRFRYSTEVRVYLSKAHRQNNAEEYRRKKLAIGQQKIIDWEIILRVKTSSYLYIFY